MVDTWATCVTRRALAGVQSLVHVAADDRLWARDPDEIARNNLDGTAAVMRAALAAGVERVVHTSSAATLRVSPATVAASEDQPLAPQEASGACKRSKCWPSAWSSAWSRRKSCPP
jgi:dihydroflavonol-4-reductase